MRKRRENVKRNRRREKVKRGRRRRRESEKEEDVVKLFSIYTLGYRRCTIMHVRRW
jgi:hypothetical protein